MSFLVKANFIKTFKIGDNINFNLKILKVLYEGYEKLSEGKKLIKPIVIINTSISEAILYDFIVNRIKRPNRTEMLFFEIWSTLKNKDLHKFEHYITQAEKYDFFELKDTNFYNAMRSLSNKRNRVHIQNDGWEKPYNEGEVFNERLKILSEKVLEKILDTLAFNYPRREEYHGYVDDFELPWNRHFKTHDIEKPELTLEEAQELGLV